jgi:hypothetical protein
MVELFQFFRCDSFAAEFGRTMSTSKRAGNLACQLSSQHAITFRGQMDPIGLVRQSAEHIVGKNNNPDAHGVQPGLNLGSLIGHSLAPVVPSGLQNHNTGSLWHRTVQSRQHSAGGVTINSGIDDINVAALTRRSSSSCAG